MSLRKAARDVQSATDAADAAEAGADPMDVAAKGIPLKVTLTGGRLSKPPLELQPINYLGRNPLGDDKKERGRPPTGKGQNPCPVCGTCLVSKQTLYESHYKEYTIMDPSTGKEAKRRLCIKNQKKVRAALAVIDCSGCSAPRKRAARALNRCQML